MSRIRLCSVLAATAGILITTGGCAGSPTGIDAESASMARMAAPSAPAPAPEEGEETMSTLSSGYIGTGTRQ